MEKFGWSVERESRAATPVWFKGIFFQSLISFFTKLELKFNHLIPFLISNTLKQTSSFFLQVSSMNDLLLPPDVKGLS